MSGSHIHSSATPARALPIAILLYEEHHGEFVIVVTVKGYKGA
jgi:hypothetical protein